MVAINADDLKQAGITPQCDAVALMEPHDGSGFRLIAALPLKNREIVRHERFQHESANANRSCDGSYNSASFGGAFASGCEDLLI